MQILISCIMGMMISIMIYIKKWQGGQKWEWQKFTFTAVVGILVGVVAQRQGVSLQNVTEEYLIGVCAAYAGVITVLQTVIQIVWNFFTKKRSK